MITPAAVTCFPVPGRADMRRCRGHTAPYGRMGKGRGEPRLGRGAPASPETKPVGAPPAISRRICHVQPGQRTHARHTADTGPFQPPRPPGGLGTTSASRAGAGARPPAFARFSISDFSILVGPHRRADAAQTAESLGDGRQFGCPREAAGAEEQCHVEARRLFDDVQFVSFEAAVFHRHLRSWGMETAGGD